MTRGTDWWPTSSGAAPLYATRRNPDLDTDGPGVGAIARALGTPLIPWQQYTADVAGERRPDGSYNYEVVIVSVPRQTGKTTLIRAVGTHRCVVAGRDAFYTAQTGKDARVRWMDLVNIIRKKTSPFYGRYKLTLRGGAEAITFLDNAAFHCFAPTPESLHGYTPPLVFIDEAFAYTEAQGDLLMGAITPAQNTIRDRQVWIVSTAGHAESVFLHQWITQALGGEAGVALFLWGAGDDATASPEDQLSPYDLDDIAAFHPGVGFVLNDNVLTAHDILSKRSKMSRAEYERAYGNRRTTTLNATIPAETWRALAPDDGLTQPPALSDITLSYDVAIDAKASAIIATWLTDTGRVDGMIVQAGPGAGWLAAAVVDLAETWRPAAVVAAGAGPVLDITDDITAAGVDVTVLTEREVVTASGWFLASVKDPDLIAHDGNDVLERSVTGLNPRASGDGGVALSRRHSVGDTAPGIAFALGGWHTQRAEHTTPLVRLAGAS